MAREKKKLTPEELSAIRRAANAMRKTRSGGRNGGRKAPKEELAKSCTIRTSKWAADVFAARAAANGITVRQALDRVAVTLARQHGMTVPDFVAND